MLECIESAAQENIPYTGTNDKGKKSRKKIAGWSEMVEPPPCQHVFHQMWCTKLGSRLRGSEIHVPISRRGDFSDCVTLCYFLHAILYLSHVHIHYKNYKYLYALILHVS